MRIGAGILITVFGGLLVPLSAEGAEETLRIDSFESGQLLSFQSGLIINEIAGVRLVPTIDCPCRVDSVTLIFGGDTATVDLQIHIWEDTGARDPGTELFSGGVSLTGSNDSLQLIELEEDVLVDGPFRVGIEILEFTLGVPTLATDFDGFDASANTIFAVDLDTFEYSWIFFPDLPAPDCCPSGDWIIRATIRSGVVPTLSPSGLLALTAIFLATGAAATHRFRRAHG